MADNQSDGLCAGAAFAHSDHMEEIWIALLEKAFAKMRGNYWAIGDGGQPGDALFALTGAPSKCFMVADTREEKLWHVMEKAHNTQGFLMVASIDPRAGAEEAAWQQKGLEPGHAYGVLRARCWSHCEAVSSQMAITPTCSLS